MKRFDLILDDKIFDEFYKSYPDYGARTALLRRCVHRLVRRAKDKGKGWSTTEAIIVADSVFEDLEG